MTEFSTDTIKLAQEKDFSGFADSIKAELQTRLAQHDVVSDYVQEVQHYQDFRAAFASINSGEVV